MSTEKSAEEKRNFDSAMTDYKNELQQIINRLMIAANNHRGNAFLLNSDNLKALSAIEALLSQHSKKRELELYNLYGSPRCDNLHHAKKHQHKALESCPVEKIINDRINQLGGQDE